MFADLFIVVAGLERSVFSPKIIAAVRSLQLPERNYPQQAWLTVAMASTLCRQFRDCWLGSEPDRGTAGSRAERRDRFLGIFQSWRAAHRSDDERRCSPAHADMSCYRSFRLGMRKGLSGDHIASGDRALASRSNATSVSSNSGRAFSGTIVGPSHGARSGS